MFRDLPNQLVMAHLVESPRGVLSGTLETTAVNENGGKATVTDFNVAGTISSGNVSLRITGALATIAGWFGGDPVLVGTLQGGRLTLSREANTLVLSSTSATDYLADVSRVDQEQAARDRLLAAVEGLKSTVRYSEILNTALDRYQTWGEQRIARQTTVKAWWTGRIHGYSRCVDGIKPLAERGVPSWQWQQCVLAIDTDAYDRNESLQQTLLLNKTNVDEVSHLERMITTARRNNSAAADQLNAVCEGEGAEPQCPKLLQTWSTEAPKLPDPAKIAAFRALAPQVSAAVSADLATATQGHAVLASLAREADHLYRPHRS